VDADAGILVKFILRNHRAVSHHLNQVISTVKHGPSDGSGSLRRLSIVVIRHRGSLHLDVLVHGLSGVLRDAYHLGGVHVAL
jgi:hypothetical protein